MAAIEAKPREGIENTEPETDTRDKDVPKAIANTEYPRGFKFVALAGASIIAVFLIALDQVPKRHINNLLPHGKAGIDEN